MNFLKNHPFAVEAFFESSIVLTFAVTKEQVEKLIPAPLVLDTFKDKWAFIAVAMVRTKNLRPKGFPKCMGNSFFLIGYRIFVRYTNTAGKRLRGLYILKSETNKRKMTFLGNLFTHYNYSTTDIFQKTFGSDKIIRSNKSNIELIIEQSQGEIKIPEGSPFSDWKEARRFAGPLPHTFTCKKENGTVLIIEGVRQNWKPEPINVKSYFFDFIHSMNLNNAVLANAFEINSIPYSWKKGKIEKWK
jgi:hypothetical protein